MTNRTYQRHDRPYLGQPGCCPCCGVDLRPEPDQVCLGGSWSKDNGKGGIMTAGQTISHQCYQCGTTLWSAVDGWPTWEEIEPSKLVWVTL